MDMILLDWTRMGRSYCLAGVVSAGNRLRVVRPILSRYRDAPVRNAGWSSYLLDGHQRWEVFELIGPTDAAPEPPHLEDLWVRQLRPCRRSASLEQRRAILQALVAPPGQDIFGAPLMMTRTSVYLPPGTGQRSLGTIAIPRERISFSASHRQGAVDVDYRVALQIPPFEGRFLPLKDHHLLARVEKATGDLNRQIEGLTAAVQAMGGQVAVRLGLSRPFQATPSRGPGLCWLMVDGLFSLSAPQP